MPDINYLPAFLLIAARISSFFVTVPILSNRSIPAMHKAAVSLFISWIVLYTVKPPVIPADGVFLLLLLKEAMTGLALGLMAAVLFSAIQAAGGFIDLQMGFALANVFDPQTGAQTPLMGRYLNTFAVLFLLATDAHHLLLDGIFYSYQFMPLESPTFHFGDEGVLKTVLSGFSSMFLAAFQMALPIVGALFLADLALGIMARTVPQLNIFVIGLPLKILISFLLLLIILPVFFVSLNALTAQITEAMRALMTVLGGGKGGG
ncbi:flagellar biosynthetic protein FliR [Fictibacillus aquaticus]|uniref:Flagellar biosynthetic protein FliR n=1 Tax=Fictibacillus aquaticus TaxID=2021314 RepID=A0A235FD45_9BACL|nr:flagellar biosynthetic protein FliR [Fictibacillus aquaticus]OYD58843.1 flagellar biosynthetic protein FliR [Fictibacillus aquaticus]